MTSRERPILFSAPMIRALLAGRKTQTRRIVTFPPSGSFVCVEMNDGTYWPYISDDGETEIRLSGSHEGEEDPMSCPYGAPGDRLWVKETFREPGSLMRADGKMPPNLYRDDVVWKADDETQDGPWRSPLFLPRRLSRLTLEVEAVRVERVQDISAADIIAEGAVERAHEHDGLGRMPVSAFDKMAYLDLISLWSSGWDAINGKRAPWASNPWVWVVTFRVVTP